MLEFLKSYNQYHIYDKAMDCELRLRAYDAITPMASFFEGALKEAYLYYYPSTSDYEVTHLDFFSLLDDTDFIKKIQYDYNLSTTEIDVIGNLIRRKSNKYKHSIFEEQSNYEVVRKCFKCVYSFSAGYLGVRIHVEYREYSKQPDSKPGAVVEKKQKKLTHLELLTSACEDCSRRNDGCTDPKCGIKILLTCDPNFGRDLQIGAEKDPMIDV